MIKLNLGCSNNIKNGYLNIDLYSKDPRVTIADVQDLNFIDTESVSEIIAHDILEHIPFYKAKSTINEWCRVLAKNGTISIQTTNIIEHIKAFNSGVWDIETLNHMLFAGHGWTDGTSRDHDWHKSVYTPEFIITELTKYNIRIEKNYTDSHTNTGNGNLNLHIIGLKTK